MIITGWFEHNYPSDKDLLYY